mmetsp:Transcript_30801/g.81835  ORF Transcript_30801/g.81835 Transcript_30801/m.81835 type:complete len:237 (-) Transcript_30801:47-757(-)
MDAHALGGPISPMSAGCSASTAVPGGGYPPMAMPMALGIGAPATGPGERGTGIGRMGGALLIICWEACALCISAALAAAAAIAANPPEGWTGALSNLSAPNNAISFASLKPRSRERALALTGPRTSRPNRVVSTALDCGLERSTPPPRSGARIVGASARSSVSVPRIRAASARSVVLICGNGLLSKQVMAPELRLSRVAASAAFGCPTSAAVFSSTVAISWPRETKARRCWTFEEP